MAVNSVSVLLRERCWHSLIGDFRETQALDDPLCAGQARLLAAAIEVLWDAAPKAARDEAARLSSGVNDYWKKETVK